jgi:hypothetical protein
MRDALQEQKNTPKDSQQALGCPDSGDFPLRHRSRVPRLQASVAGAATLTVCVTDGWATDIAFISIGLFFKNRGGICTLTLSSCIHIAPSRTVHRTASLEVDMIQRGDCKKTVATREQQL